MAAEIELPQRLFVHGYLLMEGEKMSKSLGNVLDPFAVIERFGADALRFYLLRDVPFGQDGSVSTTAFEQRYESELANEYGNLASRTLAMVRRYRDGVVPAAPLDPELASDFEGLAEEVSALLDRAELTQALDAIWQRVRRLNRYVEERAPWTLAKDEAKAGELDVVLASLAEGVRVVSPAALPIYAGEHREAAGCAGAEDRSLSAAASGRAPPRRAAPWVSSNPCSPSRSASPGCSGSRVRLQFGVHRVPEAAHLPAGGDENRAAQEQHDADDHRERGDAEAGPREDHDPGDHVEDRDAHVRCAPVQLADGLHEAHDAGDDEPHAEDQDEHDERIERFLDQHEAGDHAEHADHREQAAAFAAAEDRPEDREYAVDEQEDPGDHRERAQGFVR